jgi:C1A family cysteine protease
LLSFTALIKKVYIFIIITILLSAGGFASYASAVEINAAQLNPLFVEWQNKMDTRKTSGSDKTSTDFFETDSSQGYAPSPVDWSHLDNVAYSVINGGSDSNRRGTTLPVSYDLRLLDGIPAVRDQNPFGTCWTFAAMAAAESNLIHDKKILTKDNADLSEWYLAYYGYNDESAELPSFTNNSSKKYYDVGGDDWRSVAILSRGTGFLDESSAAYPKSTNDIYKPAITARKYKLKNALYLGNLNTKEVRLKDSRKDTIKEAIRTYGAVSIGLTAVDTSEDGDTNKYYSDTTWAYYKHSAEGSTPDHAVTIVGWDDDFSLDNFILKPKAKGAWIIRNSWGTAYHDKGYYYASYEETSLHDGVAYDTAAAPDKERVYQYDPLGLCNFINYPDIKTAYFANIFKASRNEKINSVSFYTSRPNSQGTVKIYKNCGANPIGGTLVAEKSFTLPAPGYNTVDLDSAVAIPNYGKFSVVVSISLPDIADPAIPVEYPLKDYSEKAKASAGQSFISSDGTAWDDLPTLKDYENANVCIKAFGTLDENPADTGSGGGCSTGPGMIILLTLAAMPLVFTRKKH